MLNYISKMSKVERLNSGRFTLFKDEFNENSQNQVIDTKDNNQRLTT